MRKLKMPFRSGKFSAENQDIEKSAMKPDYEITINGHFKGQIRDVEVGLITGDVTQTNTADQVTANVSLSSSSQASYQSISQTNVVTTEGATNLDITINGHFKGQIRDIEVGLITGDVTQTNIASQVATNVFEDEGGFQVIDQSILQGNLLAAIGNVDVSMIINGQFKGQIRDIEVGLITADVTQINIAGQAAANVFDDGGGSSQTALQSVLQANSLVTINNIDITIVFEGDFKGQIRDVSIGLATGDISQINTAVQVGLNVSGGHSKDEQAISQFITQSNTIDTNGDIHVILVVDADYKGKFRDIDISLVVDNILQTNNALQAASNVPADAVWD